MMMMPFFFPLSNDVLRYGRRSSLYSHTDQKERVLRLFCEPPSVMQKARVHADVHAGRRDRVQRIPARSVLHARYRSQVRRRLRRPFFICLLLLPPPPFCGGGLRAQQQRGRAQSHGGWGASLFRSFFAFECSFVETDARAYSSLARFFLESQRR